MPLHTELGTPSPAMLLQICRAYGNELANLFNNSASFSPTFKRTRWNRNSDCAPARFFANLG
jgi:hypothetical protein